MAFLFPDSKTVFIHFTYIPRKQTRQREPVGTSQAYAIHSQPASQPGEFLNGLTNIQITGQRDRTGTEGEIGCLGGRHPQNWPVYYFVFFPDPLVVVSCLLIRGLAGPRCSVDGWVDGVAGKVEG